VFDKMRGEWGDNSELSWERQEKKITQLKVVVKILINQTKFDNIKPKTRIPATINRPFRRTW